MVCRLENTLSIKSPLAPVRYAVCGQTGSPSNCREGTFVPCIFGVPVSVVCCEHTYRITLHVPLLIIERNGESSPVTESGDGREKP